MSVGLIDVRARLAFLATNEGGRSSPVSGRYRPNHNFGTSDMFIGEVQIPDGQALSPGETAEVQILFMDDGGLRKLLFPGREWRIQEGPRLIANGTVLSVDGNVAPQP